MKKMSLKEQRKNNKKKKQEAKIIKNISNEKIKEDKRVFREIIKLELDTKRKKKLLKNFKIKFNLGLEKIPGIILLKLKK